MKTCCTCECNFVKLQLAGRCLQLNKTKYGKLKPTYIEENYKIPCAQWDNTTPIKNLFWQINDAHEYSTFSKKTIEDSTLVHTAEMQISKAGVFATKYKDWHTLAKVDYIWEQFQLW